MLENLFGELANDLSIKNLIQKFGRFSFDPASSLRVTGKVTATIASNQTITNVSTANISIGDSSKTGTVILQSAQGFYGSVGANFIRS